MLLRSFVDVFSDEIGHGVAADVAIIGIECGAVFSVVRDLYVDRRVTVANQIRIQNQAADECYCTKLFRLEETLKDLPPEERYTKRLEPEKPVRSALLSWANKAIYKTTQKSALGRAAFNLKSPISCSLLDFTF